MKGMSSCCGSVVTNLPGIHEDAGWIPGLTQGVKDPAFRELWCRSQIQLGSHMAVALAQAGSCSSDSTPSTGTSICPGCDSKNQTNK